MMCATMTKVIELNVEKRDLSENLDKLREEGFVPAVAYGPVDEPIHIKFPINEFLRVWKEAGESTIIDLKGLDDEKEVLIKEVQTHPVKETPLHVDFYAIERGKTLQLSVPLEFVGEAPAEKLGGIVVRVMHEIEVETRPRNIPQLIEVDLGALEQMDSVIKVSDLKMPEGVVAKTDADEILVSVAEQKDEPEEVAAQEEPEQTEPENAQGDEGGAAEE